MADVETNKVLEYLKEYHTRRELMENFSLSGTESYNLLKWMLKMSMIERMWWRVSGKTNRMCFYRVLEVKANGRN